MDMPGRPQSAIEQARDVDKPETTEHIALAGVRKKHATEWRRIDRILISVGMFFIQFTAAMDQSATTTIQPKVLSDFNAMTRAGTISVVMYLMVASLRPIYAKVSDVYGHVYALGLAMVFHVLGSLVSALASTFSAIFAGTVFAGLGQAGYGTLVAIIIADILPINLRASVTAYVSVPYISNYYLGVELANGLYSNWHWVYGILCILAVVCTAPAFISLLRVERRARRALRNTNDIPKRPLRARFLTVLEEMDILGLLLICGGFVSILAPLGMQLNTKYGWASAQVIAPLFIGVGGLALFVYYEHRIATYPVVPFRLFKVRTFTCAILTSTFFFFTLNVSLFFFNPYVQVTQEVSARTAMLLQLGTVGFYIGLFAGGWAMQISQRYRRWTWVGWAMCMLAVGLMLHARGSGGSKKAEIAVVQALFGISGGIVVGCAGIGAQAAVDKADLTIAVTLYSMAEYVGGVLGEGVSTTIWVNLLPTMIEDRLDPSVDVFSAINNITYYFD
ncbi:hypothetical protein GGF46_003300 [Coemansia sp. RSA 552]|nr:hypothetical protein GGF46_003300 [Coemansia sp. RSA 552]